MQIAKNQFQHNINYVRELESLYIFLKHTQRLSNELSDILRAEVVYSVSALDKLIHELVKIGMLDSFSGIRQKTASFKSFTIRAETVDKIKTTSLERASNPTRPPLQSELPEYWFEQEIILKHKQLSFQDPAKISEGLSLIWSEPHKWSKIAALMRESEDNVKKTLTNIVSDRNRIVHEADINIQTGLRNIIEEADASFTVSFIEKLGFAIYDCVSPIVV